MRQVEFPHDSGRVASYEEREVKALQSLIARAERAGDPVAPQVQVLHELKIEFGAHLVESLVEVGPPSDNDVVVRL